MNECCKKPRKCTDNGFAFRKAVIPSSLGDDITGKATPKNGAYTNTYVQYEANDAEYIYDSFGVYTKVGRDAREAIAAEAHDAATKNYVDTQVGGGNSWVAIGTGSSYTRRAAMVNLNISETGLTIPADTWTSLGITLPSEYAPTITILGSVTANNNGTFEAGLVRVNTDGTVDVHTSGSTTDIYGSVVFAVS